MSQHVSVELDFLLILNDFSNKRRVARQYKDDYGKFINNPFKTTKKMLQLFDQNLN